MKLNLHKLFIIYCIAFGFYTFLFFTVGFIGVERLMLVDLLHAQSNWLQSYAPNPPGFGIWTMRPLYIICAFVVVAWVLSAAFGLFSRKHYTQRFMTLLMIIMGLTIWFYSIF